MDSDIYTNLCQNVTLQSIDIPLDERLHYLYLNDLSTQIACSGDNCELEEINKDVKNFNRTDLTKGKILSGLIKLNSEKYSYVLLKVYFKYN